MAVTAASFKIAFPEFDRVANALIEAKLAEATRELNAEQWADLFDDGVSYLAANLLSMAPQGQNARLQPATARVTREDALTTYERRFRQLQIIVSSGRRVTAGSVPNPESGGTL